MQPLVSILIPAYNSARWLPETLASVSRQTWINIETVVVDDGSRDDTYTVAKRFESARVKVVRQENAGASGARNRALALAQGDYIQWLDADDLLAPDKIERQVRVALQSENDRLLLAGNWAYFYHRPHRAIFRETALCENLTPKEWLRRKLYSNLHMQTATWLVSRRLTDEAGPWDPSLMSDDDGEYFCRVLLRSEAVRFVQYAHVYYRIAGAGSWGNLRRTRKSLQAQLRAMQLHIRYLRSLEDSASTREACVRYIQTWYPNFFGVERDLAQTLELLAIELGGSIPSPRLPWKYEWIHRLFGWNAARRTSAVYNRFKSDLLRYKDYIASQIDPNDQ